MTKMSVTAVVSIALAVSMTRHFGPGCFRCRWWHAQLRPTSMWHDPELHSHCFGPSSLRVAPIAPVLFVLTRTVLPAAALGCCGSWRLCCLYPLSAICHLSSMVALAQARGVQGVPTSSLHPCGVAAERYRLLGATCAADVRNAAGPGRTTDELNTTDTRPPRTQVPR